MIRLTIVLLFVCAVLVAPQLATAQELDARLADPTIAGAVHAFTPVAARWAEPMRVGQTMRNVAPQSVPGAVLPNRFMLGLIVAGVIVAVVVVVWVTQADFPAYVASPNVENYAAGNGAKGVKFSIRF